MNTVLLVAGLTVLAVLALALFSGYVDASFGLIPNDPPSKLLTKFPTYRLGFWLGSKR